VGHIEQFNPAIQKLKSIIDPATIHSIEARRLNFGSARIQDADVVMDLMVHDLDIILSLVPYERIALHTHALSLAQRDADYAHVAMKFQNPAHAHPVLAHVTASRITQAKVRELHVTTSQGYFTVHYGTQELFVSRMPRHASKEGTYYPELSLDRIKIKPDNALALELTNFVQAIQGRQDLMVSGERALKTLDLVWEIQNQIYGLGQQKVREVGL
jgi:predicted dehydrogenase